MQSFFTAFRGVGFAALICFLLSPFAHALEVDLEQGRQSIVPSGFFLVESTPLTLAEVRALPSEHWQALSNDINEGFTQKAYWYRFPLTNSAADPVGRLLELAAPLLDHIEFYQVSGSEIIQSFETGDTKPFMQRPVFHRNFVFPLVIAPGDQTDIYFRVQTSGSLQIPLTLWEERAFLAASERSVTGRAIFYGILLVTAAFNLFLYFSLRERAYFLYVLVVISTLTLMTSLQGFSFQYLYPGMPRLHAMVTQLSLPACQIATCLFTMEFLSLKTTSPRWYRVFQGLIGVSALSAVLGLAISYNFATRLGVVLGIPESVAAVTVGLLLWHQGQRSASLFTTAWISLLIGAILTGLNKLGLLPSTFFTEHGISLGITLQALLFSFALADRFNGERIALFKAQKDNLEAMRQRREAEALLLHSASHHELTGLPNRSLFEKAVQAKLDTASSGDGTDLDDSPRIAVVLLHVRRFDEVNKTLGHRNADELIKQGALRLNRIAANCKGAIQLETSEQGPIFAAHVEGVSFAFAVEGISRDAVIQAIDSVAQSLAQPIEFMGLTLDLSFVAGCSFAMEEPVDTLTLLRRAFVAFDQADIGANGIAVYEQDMNPYSPRRLTLMTELRTALENDALELYFQPQIHLPSQRVAGFEALLRWQHPEHGFIPPDEFIPMAEQTGLMKMLTRWVIRRALQFSQDLDRIGCDASVSVNISALNLREITFCEQVCDLLEEHQVATQRLVLEVTETAAMADPKSALAVLRALQTAQVRLSIDDFGTGHSSLSYIRKLPVQEIKIDRSFVMEMHTNQGDATIVRTTINMCHDLGYEVVAEGVENEEILEQLNQLGCDLAQGYHIARPMNREKAVEWLSQSRWVISKDPRI